jgi:hypothetical protein
MVGSPPTMAAHILHRMGYFSRNRGFILVSFVVSLIAFLLIGEWVNSRIIEPGKWTTSVPTTFALHRTAKQDCAGPALTCRISFTLDVEPADNPGTNVFRCDVRALDGHGAVVAGGELQTALGYVDQVPTKKAVLLPRARRTITEIDGTCVPLDPEGGD